MMMQANQGGGAHTTAKPQPAKLATLSVTLPLPTKSIRVSRNTAMARDSGIDIIHRKLMVHVIPGLQGPPMTDHYRHSLLAAAM